MDKMEPSSSHRSSFRTRLAAALIILAILFAAGLFTTLYLGFRWDAINSSIDPNMTQGQDFLAGLIIVFLFLLPFLAMGGVIFANYLVRPIIEIKDAAYRISKGELNFTISKIPQTRELAELALALNTMVTNLGDRINNLEQQVAERSEELVRKAAYLTATSYIARQTAEVEELSSLLSSVVRLISNQFGFYHAGIFLINETNNEAVLQAASSEGGQQMVERGYSLPIGSQGIVGYVAAKKRSHIVLDVGIDAVFFNNPDLPMTRSEIALPLLVRNKVVGVLDIQSDKPQAFNTTDIDVLQMLADQVAVAIDSAHLLDESQAASMQLETLTTLRAREAWRQKLEERQRSFTYTPLGLQTEKPFNNDGNVVTIPISLRGQKIGKISILRKGDAQWNRMDEDLVTEVAGQVGLAIDNIRLIEDATERAKQEQTIGEMAFRFNQALDIDSLLQTATRELGQLPGVEEATIFIGEISNQDKGKASASRKSKSGRRVDP